MNRKGVVICTNVGPGLRIRYQQRMNCLCHHHFECFQNFINGASIHIYFIHASKATDGPHIGEKSDKTNCGLRNNDIEEPSIIRASSATGQKTEKPHRSRARAQACENFGALQCRKAPDGNKKIQDLTRFQPPGWDSQKVLP